MTVQNPSPPEELQKVLDQKIGMGMVGGRHGTLHAVPDGAGHPLLAEGAAGGGGGGGVVGDAMGLGAGVAMGQVLAQNLQAGLAGSAAPAAPPPRSACGPTRSWPRWRSWPS